MSVKIYQDIRDAVKLAKPEVAGAFAACNNKETIVAFLDTHFPLPNDATWRARLMTQVPAYLRIWKEEHASA